MRARGKQGSNACLSWRVILLTGGRGRTGEKGMCKPGSGRPSRGHRLGQATQLIELLRRRLGDPSGGGQRAHAPHAGLPLLQDAQLGRGGMPVRVWFSLPPCDCTWPATVQNIAPPPLEVSSTPRTAPRSLAAEVVARAMIGTAEVLFRRWAQAHASSEGLPTLHIGAHLGPHSCPAHLTRGAHPGHRRLVYTFRNSALGVGSHRAAYSALHVLPPYSRFGTEPLQIVATRTEGMCCPGGKACGNGELLVTDRAYPAHRGTCPKPNGYLLSREHLALYTLTPSSRVLPCLVTVRCMVMPDGTLTPDRWDQVIRARAMRPCASDIDAPLCNALSYRLPNANCTLFMLCGVRAGLGAILASLRGAHNREGFPAGGILTDAMVCLLETCLTTKVLLPPSFRGEQLIAADPFTYPRRSSHIHASRRTNIHSYLDVSIPSLVWYWERRRRPSLPAGERTTSWHSGAEHNTPMEHRMENKQAANRGRVGGGLFRLRSKGDAVRRPLYCALQAQCTKIHSHIPPPN